MTGIHRNSDDDASSAGTAQIGIETLIVFIAMILVAAIAAAILINTQGMLQQQAQRTGEQSVEQVSTGVRVMSVTGNVTGEKIDWVNMTVKLVTGSGNLDLGNTTIHYIDDTVSKGLTYNATTATSDEFTVSTVRDPDNSSPVLDDIEDVIKVHVNVTKVRGGEGLDEGDRATFVIQPALGENTRRAIIIPQSVDGMKVVELS
ncbi:MAG: archaellin/type IV pilin N-terminal domain-containing protein [Halobacteria archaeon]|nr:archaellin/type IV pilin N-terminal domain-containing protein [Halobacteria archaeon]